jgi:hypothetical protein
MSENTPYCRDCHQTFLSWDDFVKHVLKYQSTHSQKTVDFARRYTLRRVIFKPVDENKDRIPLSAEDRAKKDEAHRLISGIEKVVLAYCPRCKQRHPIKIPVEYIQSKTAWRNKDLLMVNCLNCRR